MKKQITVMMLGLMLLINVNMVISGIQFYQTKNDLGNKTIENRMLFCYDKNFNIAFPDIKDYVSGNNFYQAYIIYNIYIQKWNNDNPSYKIDYCNMTMKQSFKNTTGYSILSNTYMTEDDLDTLNKKYFFLLGDKECIIVEQDCRYNQYATMSDLDIPADMQLVTPSWECKACQYYEWSLIEKGVEKAQILNSNRIEISDFIKKVILLNFEILLMLFWTFLILMIFVSIGLLLLGIWWLYLYIKSFSQ